MDDERRNRLSLTREQVVGFRRAVGGLEERASRGPASLRRAAWAGLQDSVPRSALLSLHARVHGIVSSDWAAPSLAQIWGPRYTAYVVPARDRAVFTLGRLPDDPKGRARAEQIAARLRDHLGGRRLRYDEVGEALKVQPNALRYAATTGTVLIRWDGARLPLIWTVAAPDQNPDDARRELVRRYLHIYGPATSASFARWAGVSLRAASTAFDALADGLVPVTYPTGAGWILAIDEATCRRTDHLTAAARLLPSGDPFFLLHAAERELLVPDPAHRVELWPPRVWPGAILLGGEIRGAWRRSGRTVTIRAWDRLSTAQRDAVEAEAMSMPLPDPARTTDITWE